MVLQANKMTSFPFDRLWWENTDRSNEGIHRKKHAHIHIYNIYIYVIYPHYIHICNEQKTYALYVEFEDRHSNRKQTYFK